MTTDHIAGFTKPISLDRRRAIAVVIDMQYASASRMAGLGVMLEREGTPEFGAERFERIEAAVPVIKSVMHGFRSAGLPVLHVMFGSARSDFADLPVRLRAYAQATNNRVGQREHEILDELKPLPDEPVLRKTTISAFASTGIDATLRHLGRDQIVITGVSTNSCVDTTARDAVDRGYECVIVEDGCAATRIAFHDAALATFRRLFGRVATSSEVFDELTLRPEAATTSHEAR